MRLLYLRLKPPYQRNLGRLIAQPAGPPLPPPPPLLVALFSAEVVHFWSRTMSGPPKCRTSPSFFHGSSELFFFVLQTITCAARTTKRQSNGKTENHEIPTCFSPVFCCRVRLSHHTGWITVAGTTSEFHRTACGPVSSCTGEDDAGPLADAPPPAVLATSDARVLPRGFIVCVVGLWAPRQLLSVSQHWKPNIVPRDVFECAA